MKLQLLTNYSLFNFLTNTPAQAVAPADTISAPDAAITAMMIHAAIVFTINTWRRVTNSPANSE